MSPTPSSRITALIFDMDGLMIDSESLYWESARLIARDYGKTCPDNLLQNMMGRAPLESVTLFCDELALPIPPERALELRDSRVARMLENVQPMPGLFDTLRQFDGQLRMAICTSARRAMVDIVMRALNIEHHFAAIQTSDGLTRGKPDPEIYLRAMQKLGIPPAECVVLEDSRNGALAAKSAGAYTIAVPSEYTASQDFSFADHRAENLNDASHRIASLLARG